MDVEDHPLARIHSTVAKEAGNSIAVEANKSRIRHLRKTKPFPLQFISSQERKSYVAYIVLAPHSGHAGVSNLVQPIIDDQLIDPGSYSELAISRAIPGCCCCLALSCRNSSEGLVPELSLVFCASGLNCGQLQPSP